MFKLSDEGVAFVKNELTRYETRDSAIIPSLYRVQFENKGWVSPESIQYLSGLMDIPESRIQEVLKFYTMFNTQPVGKYHVQVCCNISCAMAGGRELTDKLLEKYGVHEGDVSGDGRFTISRVECLGSCGTAPMMQVNDTYYENLTEDSAVKILEAMK